MDSHYSRQPAVNTAHKRHDVSASSMPTYSRRRYSEATEFYDTDFEADFTDDESPRRSDEWFAYDSSTTLSTPDLPTPETATREVFDFEEDEKPVQGPTGPHLFRSSIASSLYAKSTTVDLYLERSPVQANFPELPKTSFQSEEPKAANHLQPAVSQLDENEVRRWSPMDVANWMASAGFDEGIIEKFIINDISGQVLLTLQIEDLKELDIHSFGKRHQVMSSIQRLRDSVSMSSDSEQRRGRHSRRSSSPEISVSPTGEVLPQSRGRRGREDMPISPAESVSIVGIEQVLPKPHKCSKGENCPKYKRQQRQLALLAQEYPGELLQPGTSIITGNPGNPETAENLLRPKSDASPSVVASSDVLGPEKPKLCQEALNEVQQRDPQESIRQFLSYQHIDPPSPPTSKPVPEITTTAAPPSTGQLSPSSAQSPHMAANLRNLPKLMIPAEPESDMLTSAQRTITPGYQMGVTPTGPADYQPFSYGQYVSPADFYRQGTPFSEMDVPVTAIPNGPIARETSQSVPPDMRYGNHYVQQHEPVVRAASTRPRPAPLRRVDEDKPLNPIDDPSELRRSPRQANHAPSGSQSSLSSTDPEVTRSGWMKKRKTTRFLRHEWQEAHFTLRGTNLAMHKDEIDARRNSKALETIDVDDYAVACSSLATSSKLTAAFKRNVLRRAANASNFLGNGTDDAAFAFSLIPTNKDGEKKNLFSAGGKSHHFAVKTRDERIDWMRELMLAKALKKGKEGGGEVQVNGNFI
ncbi:hypothetical protein VTN77DRAFT_1619 [Rasamsonia byssochlamydoides]|uniref:uncharacterized protein n=1 Tax=Rasamsonia byssochlamydoides TaxID=89139 RepID=UPI0037434027